VVAIDRFWRVAALVLALAGCQAPNPSLGEADIPAGRTLVTDGITERGDRIFAVTLPEAGCRAPEAWSRSGSEWRRTATGAPIAAEPCPSATARLAADGRTLAIYEFGEGRAQVLAVDGDNFTPMGAAAIAARPGSRFPPPGPNLALSGDGSPLLLGSINRNCRTPSPAERYCGVAELFERRDGAWQRVAVLLPPPDQDGLTRFGQSVALSPDGNLALAGGTGEAGGAGTLWVYSLDRPEPKPAQSLTAPEPQPGFANALSLSADGSWLAVGGDQSVHLFERHGSGLAWRKTLSPPDQGVGYFGETVALSGDGRLLLVGAPRTDCAEGDRCGVAYLFDRDRSWGLARTIRPSTNASDANFGHHLAISRDGRHLAVQGASIHVFTLGGQEVDGVSQYGGERQFEPS
jgi:FG-GAP repeat